jgi:hypothetical protein
LFLLPLIGFALAEPRCRKLAIGVAGYVAFIVLVGGDGLYRYRFLAHVMPAIGVLSAVGIARLADRSKKMAGLGAALAVCGTLVSFTRPFFRNATLDEVRAWETHWKLVGQALESRVPKDALLATNVAGRVPYFARTRTLDMLGLADPIVARTPLANAGSGYAGHERAAPDYVVGREPDIFYISVIDGVPEPLFRRPSALRLVLAKGSLHGYAALFDKPGFTDAWQPAFMTLSDGRRAGVLVRAGGKAAPGFQLESWQP